ncbi:zonadhesin-like [Paramacrobiotus metropolitanus]|uniref:zonadhesin-like n=1 Tax=Paramacrobiotus metropolitanus TaxID=2943436 RepID=UPI0024463520|nr:zonadhesin-like [Paramacrobiotus metropolitanus]
MKSAAVLVAVGVAAISLFGCSGAADGEQKGGGVINMDFYDVLCQNGTSPTMQIGCPSCEPTCSNPVSKCPVSIANCPVKSVCVCKPGLVRTAQGTCVPVSQCSAPSPATTAASTKRPTAAPPAPGPASGAGLNIDFYDVLCQTGTSPTMQMGCPSCEATCSTINQRAPICLFTDANCPVARSCVCKPGLLRTAQRTCVPASQCDAASSGTTAAPKKQPTAASTKQSTTAPLAPTPAPGSCCGNHMLFGCARCESTCLTSFSVCSVTDAKCPGNSQRACVCEPGTVRNDLDNTCVVPSQCPSDEERRRKKNSGAPSARN